MLKVDYTLTLYRNHLNNYPELYHKKDYEEDSGVDIYIPKEIIVPAKSQVKIKLGVHCSVSKKTKINFPSGEQYFITEGVGFLLLPRSSISKTPLRLSNSIGLIDAGYRGEIMAPVDNISDKDYVINAGVRLFQLVNSELSPFEKIFESEEENLEKTKRGDGGFGSTGK